MKGYWEKPDLTAEVLENGWYYTGDAGSIDDEGYLHLAGRYKDMIITGGENVYPIEVERILDAHPDVADVAIIGTPDDKWGERVHAIIRPSTGTTPDEQALKDYCRERLAHYKCPTLISFTTDPLPLTKVNKTDKVALRKMYNKDKAGA
jgi:acyl-CoA synthetase (AMP-forming)/AMP-acid ligase II